MRPLIYVPIVHSEVDLGTMADELRQRFQAAFGADEWTRRFASVEAMWDGLRASLRALPIAWSSARLYQDGLPLCGRERDIVHELAARGSRNHQLLLELVEHGATLMGTESPALIIGEYRRIQKLLQAAQEDAPDSVVEELRREGEVILRDRDAYIAGRIDSTLEPGETAVLFIGLLHRVDELLEERFEVSHLIRSLPFGADPWRRLKEQHGHDE